MTEHTYSIDLDLKESRAMVESLIPYIYEDELYGKIGMNMPRLTPGAILLRLRRLNLLRESMNPSQLKALNQVMAAHDKVRSEWGVAYAKKLTREAESRLRDIQTYLGECKDDLKLCANAYLPEALRRTMVQEIFDVLGEDGQGLKPKIRQADSGLRRYTESCDFLWAEALRSIYPSDVYWWLYARPPQPE